MFTQKIMGTHDMHTCTHMHTEETCTHTHAHTKDTYTHTSTHRKNPAHIQTHTHTQESSCTNTQRIIMQNPHIHTGNTMHTQTQTYNEETSCTQTHTHTDVHTGNMVVRGTLKLELSRARMEP